MIWSPECGDPDTSYHAKDGTIKFRKMGYWVLTAEEAEEILRKRRLAANKP